MPAPRKDLNPPDGVTLICCQPSSFPSGCKRAGHLTCKSTPIATMSDPNQCKSCMGIFRHWPRSSLPAARTRCTLERFHQIRVELTWRVARLPHVGLDVQRPPPYRQRLQRTELTLAIPSMDTFHVSPSSFVIPLFFAGEHRVADRSAGDAPVRAVIAGSEKRSG